MLAYGANRQGSAVQWLTGWPVTREALVVLHGPDDVDLRVGFPNHVPAARRHAVGPVRVAWCGDDPADTAAALVAAGAGARRPVGTVGVLPARLAAALAGTAPPVPLDADYTRLRQTKSPAELGWLRHAARLTDASARALVRAAVPGAHQLDLLAAVESSYLAAGGTNHVHYLCSTAMRAPDRCVPAQYPEGRRLAAGDAVVVELSTAWGQDYPGQLLRTITVAAEPTARYAELHAVATEVHDRIVARLRPGTLPAELWEAAALVAEQGFGTVDDLVHGLGGGYLPPVVRQWDGPPAGLHAEPLRAGTTLVVQPNVCTLDGTAGVQTGEMYLVTDDGAEPLHDVRRGLLPGGADPGGANPGGRRAEGPAGHLDVQEGPTDG